MCISLHSLNLRQSKKHIVVLILTLPYKDFFFKSLYSITLQDFKLFLYSTNAEIAIQLASVSSLTPELFIEVPVPSQENERSCIFVSRLSILPPSTIFLFDFRNVPTVVFFIFHFMTTFMIGQFEIYEVTDKMLNSIYKEVLMDSGTIWYLQIFTHKMYYVSYHMKLYQILLLFYKYKNVLSNTINNVC